MKCDGHRPVCHNCSRSSYICVWPKGPQSLPHSNNFTLRSSKSVFRYEHIPGDNKFVEDSIVTKDPIEPQSPCSMEVIPYENHRKNDPATKFRLYLRELGDRLFTPIPFALGPKMSNQDAYLYNAFLKGFIVDITPQLAHNKLQPGAIIIPRGSSNDFVKNIFFACGSAFLCSQNSDMIAIAEDRYKRCIESFEEFVENDQLSGNEDWLLITIMCIYLREKYYGVGTILMNTRELITIMEMVKVWLFSKCKNIKASSMPPTSGAAIRNIIYESHDDDDYDDNNLIPDSHSLMLRCSSTFTKLGHKLHDFLLVNKNMSAFEKATSDVYSRERSLNATLKARCVDNLVGGGIDTLSTASTIASEFITPDYPISAWERTTLESFLYNYTLNMFFCDCKDRKHLVSPFNLFPALKAFLLPKLYDCPTPWMNNPIMGASITAFEIGSKANWLSLQLPLNETNKLQAKILLKAATYYTHPVLPTNVRKEEPEHIQKLLLESCYVGDLVAAACIIFLKKMLQPTLSPFDPSIQRPMAAFIQQMKHISPYSQVCFVCVWPIIIASSVAVQNYHRQYLRDRIKEFSTVMHTRAYPTLLEYTNIIWKSGMEFKAYDALLDRSYAKYVMV